MHSEEWNQLVECCDCGATVAPETDEAFAVNDDEHLCFSCAVRRGGIYDAAQERWTVPPRVPDVPDERRPHP